MVLALLKTAVLRFSVGSLSFPACGTRSIYVQFLALGDL